MQSKIISGKIKTPEKQKQKQLHQQLGEFADWMKQDKEKKEKEAKEKKYKEAFEKAENVEKEGKYKEAWSALPKVSEFADFAETIRKKQDEYERHFAPSLFTENSSDNMAENQENY